MFHSWGDCEVLHGTFAPAKVWLVTSPDCYQTLLQNHNQPVNNITAITIEGFCPTIADKEIAVSPKKVSIREYLLWNNKLIEDMECTNDSTDKGKWYFVTKKSNASTVSTFLDKEFQLLHQQ
eukprot:5936233-Ditylum_brightwellii.AAC.1